MATGGGEQAEAAGGAAAPEAPDAGAHKVRRGGRRARTEMRAAPPKVNPAAPGQRGGGWRPLDERGVDRVLDAAFRLLEELGMGTPTPSLVRAAEAKGAKADDSGRLRFPRALMEDIVARAPDRFVFHGRNPERSIEVGGDSVHYGSAGAAVQTLDMDTGLYRPSTLSDLYDFARLTDALVNVSWFSRCVVATDVADNFEMDANTAYALLRGTDRPHGTSFSLPEYVDPIIDMLDFAAGGEGAFAKRPFCKSHLISSVSPMRYAPDAVDVAEVCIRRGMPLSLIVASQSGATAPAPLAGALVQSTAETLGGLAMVDAFKEGHPSIFSNWPFVVDLRTGSFTGGGGECAVLNAAAAQIANRLGVPSGVAASMSDAKAIDAQMGAEKALTSLAAGLAGANLVYESSGMAASLLGASFEAFVLDDEMLSHAYRVLRGVEVDEDTLSYETIVEAVRGPGHFLGGDQTMASMERDYFYPSIADRETPAVWAEKGALSAWDRAKERARGILASHRPRYLDARVDEAIRSRLKIHLPPEGG